MRHLTLCKPVDAFMHSFSALTQSAMDSTCGNLSWKSCIAASTKKSSSLDLAHSSAQLIKDLKHFGISLTCPPKMASLTHVTAGGPHFCAHLAVSPPTQVAKSMRHLTFSIPDDAFMQTFSALTQSG